MPTTLGMTLDQVLGKIDSAREAWKEGLKVERGPDGTTVFRKRTLGPTGKGKERWERALTIRCPECSDTYTRIGFYYDRGDLRSAYAWCSCVAAGGRNEVRRHEDMSERWKASHPYSPGVFEKVRTPIPWWEQAFPVLAYAGLSGPEVQRLILYLTMPQELRDTAEKPRAIVSLLDRYAQAEEDYAKRRVPGLDPKAEAYRLPYRDD